MRVIEGDITKMEVDAIVNAANGHIGCMGAGVAGAIARNGGFEIEQEAKLLCKEYKFNEGTTYYTKAGRLPCKYIIHAVTMKYPGMPSSISIVEQCLYSIFERAKQLDCKTIAIPGLGTKIGRVPVEEAAKSYKNIIPILEERYGIEAFVCDVNSYFILLLNRG